MVPCAPKCYSDEIRGSEPASYLPSSDRDGGSNEKPFDAILGVKGIDGVYVGPADLSSHRFSTWGNPNN
ncbi:hypothetical protein CM1200mP19_1460 [bacterium]|nr:MAG: hypothetical protein CM1200mP19_1460 [bacterium]